MKKWGINVVQVMLVSAFPVLFLYFQNASEADFSEIIPMLLVFIAVGLLLLAFAGCVTRSADKGGLIASAFVLIFSNYALIEKAIRLLLPSLRYWHVLTILLVLAIHIAAWIAFKMPEELLVSAPKVIAFSYGALVLMNTLISMPQMLNRIQTQNRLAERVDFSTDAAESSDNPNVYMIIFDEYAGFDQINTYYGYDNAVLQTYLEDHHFTVSYTGHNESTSSAIIQTNLVNLEYVVGGPDGLQNKEEIRKNGRLFSLFREHGYEIRIYETNDFYGGSLPLGGASNSDALTEGGESLADIAIKNTLWYPFYEQDGVKEMSAVLEIADYLSAPANLTPGGGTLILAYFNFPHRPFLVDEDGRAIPTSHRMDWDDDQWYLGQYKYATKLMMQMMDNILTNDPESILILMSDHGARGGDLVGKFTWESMTNPLDAVYFMGEEGLNIEGLSLVNTMRAVLNRLWGMDYAMLEVPDFE